MSIIKTYIVKLDLSGAGVELPYKITGIYVPPVIGHRIYGMKVEPDEDECCVLLDVAVGAGFGFRSSVCTPEMIEVLEKAWLNEYRGGEGK